METPIEMPERPAAREFSWIQESAVALSQSPMSLTEQRYVWPGQRQSVIIKLPPMSIQDGEAWQAFFSRLNGAEGSFCVRDSSFLQSDVLSLGTPELDGDHSAGAMVKTRGWSPDMLLLMKGKRVEIAGRIRILQQDAFSDADGKANLWVWPHCRSLLDAQPVVWHEPKGVFRARSIPEFVWDKNRLLAGFQFSADEVILP
jgi:hypothetical protein